MAGRQGTLNRFFNKRQGQTASVPSTALTGEDPQHRGSESRKPGQSVDHKGPAVKRIKLIPDDADAESSQEKTAEDVPALRGSGTGTEPTPYRELASVFAKIEATTKRLEITALLQRHLTQLIVHSPSDLLRTIYLSITRIAPDYEGIELGIGEGLLLKAIAESTGRSLQQIKADFQRIGDLGDVAAASRGTQPTMFKPRPLTVQSVYKDLRDIAMMSGHSSQAKKISVIKRLLASAQGDEAKYIIRSLEGKLRIGLAEKTVHTALAGAVMSAQGNHTVEQVAEADRILKGVFSEIPNYDLVIPALLELKDGLEGLRERCKLTPGVPLKPMLAKPTKSIGEVLDRFEGEKFTCEYKYDGERGQIHLLPVTEAATGLEKVGRTRIYSRNSENMSDKYPDIVTTIPHFVQDSTKSFVLDGEVVAWDVEKKRMQPFQILATRKRKDVKEEDVKVRICYFAFDLLYLNGESLIHQSLRDRRQLLRSAFREVEGEFAFSRSIDGETSEEIQQFLEQSIQDSCEGLMVKLLDGQDSHYEPSRRSQNWLKVKKDYLSGIGDSLDLVVIGAYIGKGKRLGSYGAYLLGCLAHEGEEEIQSICKIGTGFSDEDLATLHEKLKSTVISGPKSYYTHPVTGPQPDVWFEPTSLFEVLTADLTLSPLYRAGIGEIDPKKGISLRFPRYLRMRNDKSVEQATTSEQVAEMYRSQASAQKDDKKTVDDDFW